MNKVTQSSKRNAMGIGTSISVILSWSFSTFTSVPVPVEVISAMTGVILMVVSELNKD